MEFENPVWKEVSDECKDFLKKCLEKNQYSRPAASSLLDHPWFKKSHEKAKEQI